MSLNPVPFVLLPGIVSIGFLIGQWSGVALTLASWCVVVLIGTVIHVARHKNEERLRDAERDGGIAPHTPAAPAAGR